MNKSQIPTTIIITILITTGLLSGCTTSNNENDNGENFTFVLLDGTTAELKDYRGKIVILDLWTTWCSPCQYQMLELTKAYEAYSRDDLEILSINVESGESNTDIENFIGQFKEYDYDLDWVFGNEIDDTSKYKQEPNSGIPSICFFDRNGEIIFKHVGLMLFDEIPDGWTGDKTLLKEKIDEFITQ